MKRLRLCDGQFALVDDSDYLTYCQYSWHPVKVNDTTYAYAHISGTGKNRVRMSLHRLILGVKDRKIWVDHANRNGLDCRRKNLRTCTPSQNSVNSRKRTRKTSSKFKGVSFTRGKWRATIRVNYKTIYLGSFESEKVAAQTYDRAGRKHYGEFFRGNFV
jgi:hypothetical protein